VAWRTARTTTPPALSTKPDGVLDRKQSGGSEGRGGAEQVRLPEGALYADDTGAYFLSREDLAKDNPLLFQLLEDFGLGEARSRPPGSTKESKALVVFLAACA
jgi:hypothetical protein